MRDRKKLLRIITIITLSVCLVGAVVWQAFRLRAEVQASELQMYYEVREISQSIRDYTMEHEMLAPENLNDLIAAGYISHLPLNPFTGQEMQAVPLSEAPSPGNFTYIRADVNWPFWPNNGELKYAITPGAHYILIYGKGGWGSRGHFSKSLSPQLERQFEQLGVAFVVQSEFDPYQHNAYLDFQPL